MYVCSCQSCYTYISFCLSACALLCVMFCYVANDLMGEYDCHNVIQITLDIVISIVGIMSISSSCSDSDSSNIHDGRSSSKSTKRSIISLDVM